MNKICGKCDFPNPEAARFCQNCGTGLPLICSNCSTANPREAKYCMNCGTSLARADPDGAANPGGAVIATPRRAVSGELKYDRPPESSQRSPGRTSTITGERRVVAILFADVVGSTSLAENMDPEDWTGLMNDAFGILTPAIYRYEGTVARLMGDGLLAFFGAPIAHEDDPLRAVRAGLDLIAAARDYSDLVRKRFGLDFAIRVGINSGHVVVGAVGSNQIYEYTAMGDAVNLAARLQSASRPMTVLISEMVYRRISPFVDVQDLGEIHVKGKAEPIRSYQVERVLPADRTGTMGEISPLVGRQKELDTLFHLSQTLRAGVGRLAVIVGEPGIGKTRLIGAWKTAIAVTPDSLIGLWAEGHSFSYGESVPYHLLINLLQALLEIPSGSDPNKIRQQIANLLPMEEDADPILFLSHLLSLPLDPVQAERIARLDPQALQTQYRLSFIHLLKSLARRETIHIVLDDIHWADPSSTSILLEILPIIKEQPILLCLVTRPERESPGWKLVTASRELMGPSLVELSLAPLNKEESVQVAANALQIEVLPGPLMDAILTKAEGNPLFIEEVIRMLIDQGSLQKLEDDWVLDPSTAHVDIPDQLQSLLLARVDRLPEEVRQVLRVASVIGRRFKVPVLENIVQPDKNGKGVAHEIGKHP